jgi:polysaccharide chain length determinant protein (PEP-CTERM system associated)
MKTSDDSILDILQTVWKRRKWLAVVSFLLPLTLSVSVVWFLPGIYRSTATVLVDQQQVPEAFVRPTVTSGLETRLQTISQEVFSRHRLEDIINRFQLYGDLKTRASGEEVVERMRSDIALEYRGVDRGGHRGTVAFAISFRGKDRQQVAQVANTLASLFIEENLKVRERQATGTAEFLKVQLDEVKGRLDAQERQVSAFKKRNLADLPQQIDTNLGIIERYDGQLRGNLDTQTRLSERREVIAKRLAEVSALPMPARVAREALPPTAVSPLLPPDPRLAELTRLHQELRDLRSRYSDKYPDVVRLKITIASLEQELQDKPWAGGVEVAKADAPKAGETPAAAKSEAKAETAGEAKSIEPSQLALLTNPYLLPLRQAQDEIDAEIRALKADERRLRSTIATYVARVQNAPKLEQEFKEVSRDYDTTRELYATLSKRYEEAQLAESMEQRQKGEQFRILDPAMPADEPIAPGRGRLTMMSILLSMALGVAMVVASERIRPAFHTADAVRMFTTVPVLLSIPAIVTGRDLARQKRRARLASIGIALGMIILIGTAYLIASGNEYLVSLMMRGRA